MEIGFDKFIRQCLDLLRVLISIAISVALTVVLSSTLTWLRTRGNIENVPFQNWQMKELVFDVVFGGVILGAGPALLARILIGAIRKEFPTGDGRDEIAFMRRGAYRGLTLCFLNFPCFLHYAMLHNTSLPGIRLVALLVLTGSVIGAMMGWRVYRERHPESGCFPRIGLRTLVLFSAGCGIVLVLFAPAKY